jgi:hypothetical protein
LFWTDLSRAPFWTTNGAEENSICGFGSREGSFCKGLAGGINGALRELAMTRAWKGLEVGNACRVGRLHLLDEEKREHLHRRGDVPGS